MDHLGVQTQAFFLTHPVLLLVMYFLRYKGTCGVVPTPGGKSHQITDRFENLKKSESVICVGHFVPIQLKIPLFVLTDTFQIFQKF